MAVLTTVETGIPKGRIDARGQRIYERMFDVTTDDQDDGPAIILTEAALPQFGDHYAYGNEVDLGSFVDGVDPQIDDENRKLWRVRVTYSSGDFDRESKKEDDPIDERTYWSFAGMREPIVLEKDIGGNAVLNGAGKPFDPPVEVDEVYQVLTARKNYYTLNSADLAGWFDKTNSDVFRGNPAGTVKVADIRAQDRFRGTFEYVEATWEFHVKANGWKKEILNQGFHVRGADGEPDRALDNVEIDGNVVKRPTDEPVLLRANGTRITNADLDGGELPHYIEVEHLQSRAFADLNLE